MLGEHLHNVFKYALHEYFYGTHSGGAHESANNLKTSLKQR